MSRDEYNSLSTFEDRKPMNKLLGRWAYVSGITKHALRAKLRPRYHVPTIDCMTKWQVEDACRWIESNIKKEKTAKPKPAPRPDKAVPVVLEQIKLPDVRSNLLKQLEPAKPPEPSPQLVVPEVVYTQESMAPKKLRDIYVLLGAILGVLIALLVVIIVFYMHDNQAYAGLSGGNESALIEYLKRVQIMARDLVN